MIDQFVFNEINNISVNVRALSMPKVLSNYNSINIICDKTSVPYYLTAALSLTKDKVAVSGAEFPCVNIIVDSMVADDNYLQYIKNDFASVNVFSGIKDFAKKNSFKNKGLFFYFTNLKDKKYDNTAEQEKKLNDLNSWLKNAKSNTENTFILATVIPDIDTLPNNIMGVSEREYEVIFHNKPEDSREKFLIKLEDSLRVYVDNLTVKATRLDNIFAPMSLDTDNNIITDIVKEIKEKNTITVKGDYNKTYCSAAFITSACLSLLQVAIKGRHGNIYNISSWSFNKFDIAYHLYNIFADYDIKLITEHNEDTSDKKYHILNAKKMLLINTATVNRKLNSFSLKYAVNRIASSILEDNKHYDINPINVYYGKIDTIRQLELQTLNEVDKICRENGIKYFIAGGTMLGAIRHKGFIPWDDDVDIAMLPDEYEKFLKVCPPHLSVEHSYQTTDLEPTSLYVHDKIRLKGTFFSTKYSDQFLMENGVYIDVFIYYKTSDNPRKQDRHIRQIHIMRRLMGMRWVNYPRSHIHYRLSKIALPFMRLFSLKTFKHWYIKLISKYEKKNTHFLLDSTGLNLEKVRAFPREWFDEMIDAEFEGNKYPIPKRYDDYLRHWYGDKYMELLPISSRTSVHDVVRIDLGKYVIPDGDKIPNLHEVDLRGELFEKRK